MPPFSLFVSKLQLLRPACGRASYLGLVVLVNTLLYQWPLLHYAQANLEGSGLSVLITLLLLQGGISYLALALVAALSSILLKLTTALLFIGNACALYFINSYGVLLDRSMMSNVMNTHWGEASDLLSWQLAVYVVVLGLLPALVLGFLRILPAGRLPLLSISAAVLLTTLGGAYAASSTWLWIDQHAKRLGGLVLPWSYVANSVRHWSQVDASHAPQALLPLGVMPETQGEKEIVVLVIGEAARAANISYYGYPRDTTPYTRDLGLQALPNARSCATYTTAALACILSHVGNDASVPVRHEPLPSYLARHDVDVIWRSNNNGEPHMAVSSYQRRADIVKGCVTCDEFDAGLLHGLQQRIAQSTAKQVFVVLHLAGSHGPAYHRKYPMELAPFTPACAYVELANCPGDSLVNAYDNSLVYTDYVLASLIDLLKRLPNPTAMLYLSDHGESLGEHGLYLHGTPNALAPDFQRDIPFYVWASPRHPRVTFPLPSPPAKPTQDLVFHSVLGAFGLKSPIYRYDLDLFGGAR